jgi:CubicO group peptidase (beta-lactamase class C family)
VDPNYLARADRYAREEAPHIGGMMVVRHGCVVFERYYREFTAGSYFSVASVTKSVLSALTGIALRDGLLASIDQPTADFFPGADTHGLTLRHLLTLTAGWPYRDFMERSETVPAILGEPLPDAPGARFRYGENPPHLLSAILGKVSGGSAAEFARRELFAPLGMWRGAEGWDQAPSTVNRGGVWPASGLPWKCDQDGVSGGGFGLHLTIADMARFGLLYASGGSWAGRQIVPADYVAESTRAHSRGGSPMWMPYGWMWWVPAWHKHGSILAAGYGGQIIYVNSSLDLVIAVAGSGGGQTLAPWEVLERYLISAVQDW